MTLKDSNIEVYFSPVSTELDIPDTKISLSIGCSYKDIVAIITKLHPEITTNIYIALEGYIISENTSLDTIIKEHDLSLEKPLNIEILYYNKTTGRQEYVASSPVSVVNSSKENIAYGCHDGSISFLNITTKKQTLIGKLNSKITAINDLNPQNEDLIISTSDGTLYQTTKNNNIIDINELYHLKGSIVNTHASSNSSLLISGLEEGSFYYTNITNKQNIPEVSKEGSYLTTNINKRKYNLDDFLVLESGFDIFAVLNSRKLALFDLTSSKGNLIRDYLPAKVFSICVRNNHKNIIGLGLHNGVKFIDMNSKRNDHKVIPYNDVVTGIQFIDENKYYTSTLKGAVCTSDIRYEGIINKTEIGSDVYNLSLVKGNNTQKENKKPMIVLGGDYVYTISLN